MNRRDFAKCGLGGLLGSVLAPVAALAAKQPAPEVGVDLASGESRSASCFSRIVIHCRRCGAGVVRERGPGCRLVCPNCHCKHQPRPDDIVSRITYIPRELFDATAAKAKRILERNKP